MRSMVIVMVVVAKEQVCGIMNINKAVAIKSSHNVRGPGHSTFFHNQQDSLPQTVKPHLHSAKAMSPSDGLLEFIYTEQKSESDHESYVTSGWVPWSFNAPLISKENRSRDSV